MSDIRFITGSSDNTLPISAGAIAGDFMYTWGDGAVVRPGHEKDDMRQVFDRLGKLLADQGLTFADVAKVTALLTDTVKWDLYTEVYKEYFKPPYPCRTTIPIKTDDPILEIDLVAYKKGLSAQGATAG
jgi:peptide/nickel transport system substrate-binding protein/2-iminobutanoate/2-iminopropanoate deaminase